MMTRAQDLLLVICLSAATVGCADGPTAPPGGDGGPEAQKRVVASANRFGFDLFRDLVTRTEDGNVFISPLSVSMALGMTYNGADGSTREAMEATLGLSGLTAQEVNESYRNLMETLTGLDPKVTVDIANSIWYAQRFRIEEEFLSLNRTAFGAEVRGLDFRDPGVPGIINGWVRDHTRGKIDSIVDPPIDPLTVMFLINAVYFKGTWTYEFDEALTQEDLFTLPGGSRQPCRMMRRESEFRYLENADFQAVDLPYGDGAFSMTVLLPRPEKSPDALIAMLDEGTWDQWVGGLSEQLGTLELPRFKLEYEETLNEALAALGMGIAFTDGADFTRMRRERDLYINKVKHKTFVEVNEEGTEAAAVTSVEMMTTSADGPTVFVMRVDRPFLLVIWERDSGTLLFIGKIAEPTST